LGVGLVVSHVTAAGVVASSGVAQLAVSQAYARWETLGMVASTSSAVRAKSFFMEKSPKKSRYPLNHTLIAVALQATHASGRRTPDDFRPVDFQGGHTEAVWTPHTDHPSGVFLNRGLPDHNTLSLSKHKKISRFLDFLVA
jgi:hypothetical protein